MNGRRYTQPQVEAIFEKAAACAERRGTTNWDAFMLGYVSSALGVDLTRIAPAVFR